jgi:PKD repeat protein
VLAGTAVTLDGRASFDPGGQPLAFLWSQVSGTLVELDSPNSPTPGFVAPEASGDQALEFELTISAGGEESDPDRISVTVIGADPSLPVARLALDPVSGAAPLSVSLDGSASTAADGHALVDAWWRFSDDTPPVRGLTGSCVLATPGGVGVELLVIDDAGQFDTAQGLVSVQDGGGSPPLLQAWAVPERGEAPLEVRLRAEASDPDGTATTVDWELGGGARLSGTDVGYVFASPGQYTVVARATDEAGQRSAQRLTVVATAGGVVPPRLQSSPELAAQVGQEWTYLPIASGTPPLEWSLGKHIGGETRNAPEGMTQDAASGGLRWTPEAPGDAAVTLVVKNAAGSDFQDFTLAVTGNPADGCGCSSAASGNGLLLLLSLFWIRRRQPR